MGLHFGQKSAAALAERLPAGTVLVAFGEPDAPTCRLEEPVLSQIQRRYDGRVQVVLSDVDASPKDAAAYAVTAVPTFLLLVEGVGKWRRVGYQSADELTRAIEEALPPPG